MKKKSLIILLLISTLIICFLLTFIPHKIVNIVPEDVSSIHIFNGRNGKYITVTDKDTINHIISNLNSVTFQKDKPSMFRMGYGFKITIYTDKYFPYKQLIINSNTRIRYFGFFYNTKINNIDYEFIDSLVN